MGYAVQCNCGKSGWAINIVDLITNHTDERFGAGNGGAILCKHCGSEAAIHRKTAIMEGGHWERYIRGVIRIPTGIETYSPFVFLTSPEPGGEVDGIHFGYYKDLRPQGGRLKLGTGPGGAPVLGPDELIALLKCLVEANVLSRDDLRRLADD